MPLTLLVLSTRRTSNIANWYIFATVEIFLFGLFVTCLIAHSQSKWILLAYVAIQNVEISWNRKIVINKESCKNKHFRVVLRQHESQKIWSKMQQKQKTAAKLFWIKLTRNPKKKKRWRNSILGKACNNKLKYLTHKL